MKSIHSYFGGEWSFAKFKIPTEDQKSNQTEGKCTCGFS